jgi:hypothetical protein
MHHSGEARKAMKKKVSKTPEASSTTPIVQQFWIRAVKHVLIGHERC